MIAAFAAPALGQVITVRIYNNTTVDLCIHGSKQKQQCVPPGQAARASMSSEQWIDFGMEAHQYKLSLKALARPPADRSQPLLKLQAEPDGFLYFVPPQTNFPARPLGTQPPGYPLKPVKVADLT